MKIIKYIIFTILFNVLVYLSFTTFNYVFFWACEFVLESYWWLIVMLFIVPIVFGALASITHRLLTLLLRLCNNLGIAHLLIVIFGYGTAIFEIIYRFRILWEYRTKLTVIMLLIYALFLLVLTKLMAIATD